MSKPSFFWRLKWLLVLLIMLAIDFTPVPLSAAVLLYVFLFKPPWFKALLDKLYSE